MSLLKLVVDAKKVWAWCKAHWKWIALGTAGLVLYCMGRGKGKNLLIAAQAARDQYLKDKGIWDNFYQYEHRIREQIAAGDVKVGWGEDMLFMSWGQLGWPPWAQS